MSDQIKTVDNQKFSFRPVLFFIRVQSPTLNFYNGELNNNIYLSSYYSFSFQN
jgi:hypothetical protein